MERVLINVHNSRPMLFSSQLSKRQFINDFTGILLINGSSMCFKAHSYGKYANNILYGKTIYKTAISAIQAINGKFLFSLATIDQ